MRARTIIAISIVVGASGGATALAAHDGDSHAAPQMREAFHQAIKDAGLQDAPSVRGTYVPGEGWVVENAGEDAGGYAPLK